MRTAPNRRSEPDGALDEMALDGMLTVLLFHRVNVCDLAFVGDEHSIDVHAQWIDSEIQQRHRAVSRDAAV